MPGGGIEPARSFAITRSHTSALALGLAASRLSSARPAVRNFWLWQAIQCASRNARGLAAADCEGDGTWAPNSAAATVPLTSNAKRRLDRWCVSILVDRISALDQPELPGRRPDKYK